MYVPDFDVSSVTDDYDFDEATDDVIQRLYSEAREHIKNELGVEVNLPTPDNVVFRYSGDSLDCEFVSVTLQYVETGGETFHVKKHGDILDLSEQEFTDLLDEKTLQKLKKAITIYSKIAEAQRKCVSQDVLEKYI